MKIDLKRRRGGKASNDKTPSTMVEGDSEEVREATKAWIDKDIAAPSQASVTTCVNAVIMVHGQWHRQQASAMSGAMHISL